MICEECGRNDAIVHIVQIGPGGRSEKNICMSCAARYGASILRARHEISGFPADRADWLFGLL